MPQYRGQNVRYRRRGLLRLRLRQLLETRGLTPYGLAKFTGLSLNTIYRLTRRTGRFGLIRADTIERLCGALRVAPDRKSTRLNSSHGYISYAVFCLKKKKNSISTPSLPNHPF